MNATTLTKRQTKKFRKDFMENGEPVTLIAEVRYDDDCGNGHNTFAITGERYEKHRHSGEPSTKHNSGATLWLCSCGCLHDDIAERFPELATLIKWHLCSSDGPMHYVANSQYWAGQSGYCNGGPNDPPNLEHFRSTAIWPEATEGDMKRKDLALILESRLEALMADFRAAVESLGFTY